MAYQQIIRPKGDIDNQPAGMYRGRLEDIPSVLRLIDSMLAEIYGNPVSGGATFGYVADAAPGSGSVTGYAPTGFGTTTGRLDISANASDTTVNDLPAGSDGQRVRIRNTGTGTLTLTNENSGSTAANRFSGAGDVAIPPGDSIDVVYYAGSISRWTT